MLEPADPLVHIEELDALLTQRSLRRLPLWLMGSNDVLQGIADARPTGTTAPGWSSINSASGRWRSGTMRPRRATSRPPSGSACDRA